MSEKDTQKLAILAKEAILSKKGMDPVILEIESLSSIADYFVLATGRNGPHLKALAAEVSRIEADAGRRRVRTTGTPESGWIVLDFLGVVVHLFEPERRRYYAIEQLWNDAPRLD
ncbi:MAG: ribosome silencing factor [Kiritimatiellia bacterium]|nr:ribosome silencing factor [Kiritimatiellia bacterium]